MLDAMAVADLPRDKPLKIAAKPRGFTCVLCGASQESHSWGVSLPPAPGSRRRSGTACPGCADDRGWAVA